MLLPIICRYTPVALSAVVKPNYPIFGLRSTLNMFLSFGSFFLSIYLSIGSTLLIFSVSFRFIRLMFSSSWT